MHVITTNVVLVIIVCTLALILGLAALGRYLKISFGKLQFEMRPNGGKSSTLGDHVKRVEIAVANLTKIAAGHTEQLDALTDVPSRLKKLETVAKSKPKKTRKTA